MLKLLKLLPRRLVFAILKCRRRKWGYEGFKDGTSDARRHSGIQHRTESTSIEGSKQDMTLERKHFSGTLSADTDICDIEFDVWTDESQRLQVEVMPIPARALANLQGHMGEPGSVCPSLTLIAKSDVGESFLSQSVDVRGVNYGTSGNVPKLRFRRAEIGLECSPPAPLPSMRLWFRGFTSFRNPAVESKLGVVEVAGNSKVKSKEETSGYVAVHARQDVDLENWTEKADTLLTFLHRGLSLAHGGRLQVPRQDVIVGDRWTVTYYDGEGFPRSLGPIPHLHQGPMIEALVRRFESDIPFPDMLWTAIGWLHMELPFDEARFLMSMTALETVVEHLITEKLSTIIPKSAFKDVRERLDQALGTAKLEGTAHKIFSAKISGLNMRTLAQKVEALRDCYGLSKEDFSNARILDAIKARNAIVHSGVSAGREKTWPQVVFVREFLTRIAFKVIRYDGPFEKYLDGYEIVHPQNEKPGNPPE